MLMMDKALFYMRRSGQRFSIGSICLLILIALYVGYEWGSNSEQSESIAISSQTPVNADYQALIKMNEELRQKLVAAQHNYQIQLEAKKNLAEYLKLLQKNNAQLTRDMAIYHSVKGDLPKHKNLHVSGFQVFSTEKSQTFRYLIMISKQKPTSETLQGTVNMTIVGRIGKKSIFLPVRYENSVQIDGLAYQLRDFQEFAGELSFPPGFIPELVSFKIHSNNGKLLHEQEYQWKLSS